MKNIKKYCFYHIPKRNLSKVRVGIDYLAFYQPKSTFKEESGICYFAKIKDIIEYKRGECLELTCKKDKEYDEYIRFEIEELVKIGPISSVEYEPVNISYTTIYLLKNATTMHELYVKNRKEIKLYKLLKHISINKNLKLIKDKGVFYIGKNLVKLHSDNKVYVNEEIVYIKDFEKMQLHI